MNRQIDFLDFDQNEPIGTRSKTRFPRTVNVPDQCPQCKFMITPIVLPSSRVAMDNGEAIYAAVLLCQHCCKPFIAYYSEGQDEPWYTAPNTAAPRIFDEKIQIVSAEFSTVYNQALHAESLGLTELAGMGYRKAVEYLIKDYLIMRSPDDADTIKAEALGSCINNRINNERLKNTARSAVWIGNDFVHYTRKYGEYDISHLKNFIEAVLYWILMELITDETESMDRR